MKLLVRLIVVASIATFVAAAAFPGDESHCKALPEECEKAIRAFLAEKKYLGVTLQMTKWGVVIKSVAPESPASKSGLRAGDRLIGINGVEATTEMAEVKKLLLPPGKGRTLMLTINRLGEIYRIQVELAVMPDEQIRKIVEAHLRRAHSSD